MALGPIWENIENAMFQRIDQNTLVFSGRSIAFKFINRNSSWQLLRSIISNGIQQPCNCLHGYAGKF